MRDNIDNSSVFKDFVKIAQSYGWVKEADDKDVIKDKYNVTDETGKELIDKAHPDEIWVAEALGDGGLVENQNEQHDTLMSILYKTPEGSLLGRHADLVNSLTKTANNAYIEGNISSYNRINNTIHTLDSNFYKKAWGPVLSFIGAALLPFIGKKMFYGKIVPHIGGKMLMMSGVGASIAALFGLGSKLTDRKESLSKDMNDVIKILEKIISDDDFKDIHPNAKIIIDNLNSFSKTIIEFYPKNKEEAAIYAVSLQKLQTLIGPNGAIMEQVKEIEKKKEFLKFGIGKINRCLQKIGTLKQTLAEAIQSSAALTKVKKFELTGNSDLVQKDK